MELPSPSVNLRDLQMNGILWKAFLSVTGHAPLGPLQRVNGGLRDQATLAEHRRRIARRRAGDGCGAEMPLNQSVSAIFPALAVTISIRSVTMEPVPQVVGIVAE